MKKKIAIDPSHAYLDRLEHPLDPFFNPKSIAIIGATNTPNSVGNTLMQNLKEVEFSGEIFPVNPKYDTLFNRKCYPCVTDISGSVDLTIIITPAKTVPKIISQCTSKGIKAAIIISAGFKELGEEGLKLENEVLKRAREGDMRIVGPNCLGIMNPIIKFNGTFASSMALEGKVAFISQSGAMCSAVLDWSFKEKIGFSAFVSIGSMADVDWGDLIDYLGNDSNTQSILIYMESIGDAKSFMRAAREVALNKPIIVIKAGRTEAAAQAAASHTGSMAGSDDIFDVAMARCGVLRVDEISELFGIAEVLAQQPTPSGPSLAILTNAGGPAVLATDSAARSGAKIAELSSESIDALNKFLPEAWSHSNPVDLLGDAGPDRYAKALEVVSKDLNVDGILVILSPQDMTDIVGTAETLCPFAQIPGKPILASWMGGISIEKGVEILHENSIPAFSYPDSASKIFSSMWKQYSSLQTLYETPEIREDPSEFKDRVEKTENIIKKALSEDRYLLTEDESKQVLSNYKIPVVETWVALNSSEAVEAASSIGYPTVLKLHSETITHKTEVGGVLLNLNNAKEVAEGFEKIKNSVTKKAGAEHFQGVTVQKMVNLEGYEIIMGSTVDPQFGPVALFGTGGQLVEVYKDRAMGLPPLNASQAKHLISQTKIYEALKGVRGRAAVDFSKLEKILISFSELIISHPNLLECDINPLIVSSEEMIALDARIILSKNPVTGPVIRPYPLEYISNWNDITIRPVRPEDEPLFEAFHRSLSKKTVRARYFEEMTLEERTNHERMIRICHADYSKEILLCAFKNDKIIGLIRLSKTCRSNLGVLKIIVIDSMQKKGLGTKLLSQAIQVAGSEGLKILEVHILKDNETMKKILSREGFTFSEISKSSEIIKASLSLKK